MWRIVVLLDSVGPEDETQVSYLVEHSRSSKTFSPQALSHLLTQLHGSGAIT